MKTIISLCLFFLACGVTWAQAGWEGSVGPIAGVTVKVVSKLEPPTPEMHEIGRTGVRGLHDSQGVSRYWANASTHEYFGYDLRLEPVDQNAGTYRVTFSALSLTPAGLGISDAVSWRMLPPPVFPAPRIITTSDTIAVELLENPGTGQKIVDYIRLVRDNCEAAGPGDSQLSCLNGLLQDERQSLASSLKKLETSRDAAAVEILRTSEQIWEQYRDAACTGLAARTGQLTCEIKLTRSHAHDLGTIY